MKRKEVLEVYKRRKRWKAIEEDIELKKECDFGKQGIRKIKLELEDNGKD